MNTQELRDKHLEAINKNTIASFGKGFAADACTQVSIQFAIDVLENCYGDDDTIAGQVSDNVKDRIEELKQQLKP